MRSSGAPSASLPVALVAPLLGARPTRTSGIREKTGEGYGRKNSVLRDFLHRIRSVSDPRDRRNLAVRRFLKNVDRCIPNHVCSGRPLAPPPAEHYVIVTE